MSEEIVLIESHDHIYTLTIHRPQALNALNKDVFDILDNFFTKNMGNYEVRGVVITGAGEKAFVAGADIKEFSGLSAEQGSALSKRGQDVFFKIEQFHAPVIAAVNGFALGGGCELAMACHIRVGGTNAKFGQPEVNLGLIPGYGGSQRLVQWIGKGKAIEMLLTADMIHVDEALALGLVTHKVEAGQEVHKAKEILQKIMAKGPLAVTKCIKLVNTYFDIHSKGYVDEYSAFGTMLQSYDCNEGVSAFLEKRKPNFKAQ
jgi:enoyl-CoA hydratase